MVQSLTAVAVLAALPVAAQSTPPAMRDSAAFDHDGTAHITRVMPVPATISPEAQKWLESLTHKPSGSQTRAQRRAAIEQWRSLAATEAKRHYPVAIEPSTIAGVRTDVITPLAMPAAVDDVIAVYRELLKTYKPQSIGIYGTSAGAILTCKVAVKLKQLGLPLPAALGVFSGLGDFSRVGESRQLFRVDGFPGDLAPTDPDHLPDDAYVGNTDRRDPSLSPLFADWRGMPPSLLLTSTRDLLLSDTSLLHRAMLHAGVDAQLIVFEALPQAFWHHFEFPETREALELMAAFLDQKVAH
jgi:hypothetical protein